MTITINYRAHQPKTVAAFIPLNSKKSTSLLKVVLKKNFINAKKLEIQKREQKKKADREALVALDQKFVHPIYKMRSIRLIYSD